MVSTIERPTGGLAQPPSQTPRPSRLAFIAIATLAVIAVVLGITVIYQATNDDGPDVAQEVPAAVVEEVPDVITQEVPDAVQAVLDDFIVAMENYDYEALQALVTDSFRRPFYMGDPTGSSPYRDVMRIENYDFFEREVPLFDVERVGEPIVRGNGPWYVSVAENWQQRLQAIREESISTYVVVVDRDGVLRVDDAYWVGHPVVSE